MCRLVPPSATLRESFQAMVRETVAAGESRHLGALDDFDAYLAHALKQGHASTCDPGLVPQDHLWWIDDAMQVVGSCRIRHGLSVSLRREGGHVGYDIRPSCRGRGHATRLLAEVLRRLRARGVTRVLVTCDASNVASARVIQKNGGIETTAATFPDKGNKVVRRFWIVNDEVCDGGAARPLPSSDPPATRDAGSDASAPRG